jgi:hypothetical protein
MERAASSRYSRAGAWKGRTSEVRSSAAPADWRLIRPDGVTVADAIDALRTDDDVVVQIRNRGLRHGPPGVMQRLMAGDDVSPSEHYLRTVPEVTAPAGRYEWLNRSIFICAGARSASGIKLWVSRVL